jgi:hypothetical protein
MQTLRSACSGHLAIFSRVNPPDGVFDPNLPDATDRFRAVGTSRFPGPCPDQPARSSPLQAACFRYAVRMQNHFPCSMVLVSQTDVHGLPVARMD